MSGIQFKLEALLEHNAPKAHQVTISSNDPRGQECLFHFNRLFRKAVNENDYRSIFRSLGMLSDDELSKINI